MGNTIDLNILSFIVKRAVQKINENASSHFVINSIKNHFETLF